MDGGDSKFKTRIGDFEIDSRSSRVKSVKRATKKTSWNTVRAIIQSVAFSHRRPKAIKFFSKKLE